MAETEDTVFFFGEFEHTLDSQRRVAIPSEWRSQGADARFVLIPGKDNTLLIYTFQTFNEKIMSRIKHLSPSNAADVQKLARLGSQTQQCVCDKQGRIQISQKLIDYAGLKDKIALVGSLDFGLITTPENWNDKNTGNDEFLDIL